MSKIDDLIQKLCPNGVEYKELASLLKSLTTGLNPRRNFILNQGENDKFYVTVKEITSGKIEFSNKTDRIDSDAWFKIQQRSHLENGDILLSGIGTIGKVALVSQDMNINSFNCSESVFLLKPNDMIDAEFLVHILRSGCIQNIFKSQSRGSTLKGIRQQDLRKLKIPVPPLEVQEEIVRVLNSFTELEAELEARKKQYEHYRNQLLNFAERERERESRMEVIRKSMSNFRQHEKTDNKIGSTMRKIPILWSKRRPGLCCGLYLRRELCPCRRRWERHEREW